MYIKSPFNWVGNKYKYLDKINEIVNDKKYEKIIEPFMGTGNILLNINAIACYYIGNDIIPLVPKIYSSIKTNRYSFKTEELKSIINAWNRFTHKDDYYTFRNFWNNKYINNIYDKDFIYETALLLKMCSNSMVRFNKSGRFNQGFRGFKEGQTEFFNDNMIISIVNQLNLLSTTLNGRNYIFLEGDFKKVLKNVSKNDLLILDPPYILRTDMYNLSYDNKNDEYLLEFLSNTNIDFIYFNYVEADNVINNNLEKILKSNKEIKWEIINNKSLTGQGRKGEKSVKEIIATNIK